MSAGRRDSRRSRVYAAEQFVRNLFDEAARHGSGAVEFFGAPLTLPPEARFGSVEAVQRYVDEVLAMPSVSQRWPDAGPVAVRTRRAATAAHYCGPGVIAVPDRADGRWALRELVVLHEVAHHLCDPAAPAHGREFVATFCDLAAAVMGPEAGHVLRVVYSREGAG